MDLEKQYQGNNAPISRVQEQIPRLSLRGISFLFANSLNLLSLRRFPHLLGYPLKSCGNLIPHSTFLIALTRVRENMRVFIFNMPGANITHTASSMPIS
jgi:hypothetical protein